ncbi:MAG TPA: NnrS family protein, partial [Acidimicrobiia bacterium]|nr:NnrS family protein [Acidimicrobiia bacterium]
MQAIETKRQLTRARPPARRVPGHRWFFPAATLYAIVVVPASIASMLGVISIAPGLASPARHAHEMLFGFA